MLVQSNNSFENKGTSVDRSHESGDFYQFITDSLFARDKRLS